MKVLFHKYPKDHEIKLGYHKFVSPHVNSKYWGFNFSFRFFFATFCVTYISNWYAYIGKK